jgi:aminoglycoside 6-adenylyltransferase
MNGSRANPNAPRDRFQDFDIAFFVTDVEPFKNNIEWIRRFGELMILQMPEAMQDPPPENMGSWIYLMQFMDGNRIDLGINLPSRIAEITADSQTVVLLDKDGLIPSLPPTSDRDYVPQPPSAKAFTDCCNEFWWVSVYVAKGLWRQEILYAKYYLDHYVRDQLSKMLDWTIGVRTHFNCSPGKYGKYVQRYLETEEWGLLLKTYSDADYAHTWEALSATCTLFRNLALEVAGQFGFKYTHQDDECVSAYLEQIKNMLSDQR